MAFAPATCRSNAGERWVYSTAPAAIPMRNDASKTMALTGESWYRAPPGRKPMRSAALTAWSGQWHYGARHRGGGRRRFQRVPAMARRSRQPPAL
jgi:hypothetical protein